MIMAVEIQYPFREKVFEEVKFSVLDVKALDANRALFNFAMETKAGDVLRQLLLYYNAALLATQLLSGKRYQELLSAIRISVLKEPLFPRIDAPHLNFMLRDFSTGRSLSIVFQIHTIELAKLNYPETLAGVASYLQTASPLERWANFLSNAAALKVAELQRLLPERIYLKATEAMEMFAPIARKTHALRGSPPGGDGFSLVRSRGAPGGAEGGP